MKRKVISVLFVALFAIVFGCSDNVFAQNMPMVGGFKSVSVNDQQVKDAATFAVSEIGTKEEMDLTLGLIHSAQMQVGQIFNFKMLFQTSYADGGENYDLCINAQVSRSIKKEYKLVSWDSVECPE